MVNCALKDKNNLYVINTLLDKKKVGKEVAHGNITSKCEIISALTQFQEASFYKLTRKSSCQ